MRHVERSRTEEASEVATADAAGTGSLSEHMRRLLRADEDVIWTSKPNKKAHYVTKVVGTLFALFFFGSFFGFFVLGGTVALAAAVGLSGQQVVAVMSGLGLLSVLAVVGIVYFVTRRSYDHAEFGLTDDRAIMTTGVIGRDSSSVSLKDVRDVDVNVGLVDKIFGTGRINLQVAGGMRSGASFKYVDEPYALMETIEKARKAAQDGGPDRPARS